MKLKNRYVILVLLLFISIGFAVLTSNLSINGTASFTDASFNVHFENAKVEDKNIDDGTITINSGDVTITSTGTFDKPGDYINTSFYVINSGTMDASLDTLSVSGLTSELQNYFAYTLKYDIDGINVTRGDVLRAGQGRKINLHIEYKYDVEELTTASNLNLTITMNYINPKKVPATTVWDYEYTGGEQYFIANKTGTYKIEAWGAQGGDAYDNTYELSSTGGYGGYSTGTINLTKNQNYYINVGGAGIRDDNKIGKIAGGYNGGGNASRSSNYPKENFGSGGGATHIALISGILSSLTPNSEEEKNIIIVAAGGGGAGTGYKIRNNGGSGGGYIGVTTKTCIISDTGTKGSCGGGATQTAGGKKRTEGSDGVFGKGASYSFNNKGSGGGGGYYGGGSEGNRAASAGGGSGYIGNSNLTNKIMYCYNCQESTSEEDETNIKTRSTTNVSEEPISNYAKIGDGFARITYLGN